jgi:hypothetical protein
MLLFKKSFHAGLVSGDISLTFRRWEKPQVRAGGRYRCHPIGVLVVDSIERAPLSSISERDARRAGFASLEELIAYLHTAPAGPMRDDATLFRVELHHGGDGDRVDIALDGDLGPDDIATITARLARMDRGEPWTRKTLRLIEKHPRVAASKLAAKLGRDTAPFKVDVRKLKRLGLTQSFEVGYELSPRGWAYLSHVGRRAKRSAKKKRRRPC